MSELSPLKLADPAHDAKPATAAAGCRDFSLGIGVGNSVGTSVGTNLCHPMWGGKSLRQMFLSTQAVCLSITLMLTLIGGAFWINLIYSFIIGNTCSVLINAGRLGMAVWKLRGPGPHSESLRSGWPGWPVMVPISLLGGSLGYLLGANLAHFLTGHSGTVPTGDTWRGWAAIFVMSLVASLVVTWYFFSRASLAAAEAAQQASARLAAQTQLKLLQSQLEPHMLFNTLANLRALIAVDPERAQDMLDRLIDFLRATLSASRSEFHPLQAEFERTSDYLSLMQVRMGSRLTVLLDLPPELAHLPIPPLLLQPLVENAIRHGLEPQRKGGEIKVSAQLDGAELVLQVADSGRGLELGGLNLGIGLQGDEAPTQDKHQLPDSKATAGGFGTAQIRERLATLYGAQASFRLIPRESGGTLAEIRLPAPAAWPTSANRARAATTD